METPNPAKTPLIYSLGLDIGMASVGAALLTDDHIHALHVRTFNAAETAKEGESLNLIRREARLTRRRIRRRAFRLTRLRRLFKRMGLISSHEAQAFATTASPWELRAEGLNRKLETNEWAAALYHIVKHRGFQSNRKSEVKDDEKAGQMLSGVSANQTRMIEGGWRTMGEMAAYDETFATAKRNKGGAYTHTFARSDLEDELRQLFAVQRDLANPHSAPGFEADVHDLLMARKPTLSGDDLLKMVGKCTFEPSEYRAPKASHTAERFIWLTRLNNTRITGLGVTRELSDEEHLSLLELPFTQAKLTYKQARKAANLAEQERFVGLAYRPDKDPESAVLFEAKAFHKLRQAYENAGLKTEWARDAINPERLDTLAYAQTAYKDDREAREYLAQRGIEPAIIEAVLNVSFSDFIRLSIQALRKIIPHMESGMRYDEAVLAAGYQHHSNLNQDSPKSRRIPPINKEDFPNPVVYRALNQARKLVNAIIDEYGAPIRVHIELARDLSKSFDERRDIKKEQDKFRDNKEQNAAKFLELFGQAPKKDQLDKLRLYDEQDGKCAYSLTPLDLRRLDEIGYVEIDHALPYSRSFDNGMNNKALVLTHINRDKGNQTPYEYLGGAHNDPRWHTFEIAVRSNKKYRQAKRDRLLRKDFDEKEAQGFRERNLTDTRYIARAFKTLVEKHLQLASDSKAQRCVIVSGQLTAFLRARWGFNKVRADGDLHHALDAAVVAACSHSMVKRLSDYSRRKELEQVRNGFTDPQSGEVIDIAALRQLEEHFPKPWPHFREELLAHLHPDPALQLEHLKDVNQEHAKTVQPIRVSRAPLRRGTGQAHQETIRSAKRLEEGISSVKTSLESLKLKDIENIVGFDDPRNEKLINAIRERLQQHGDDGKKAFKEPLYKPSKEGKNAPIVRSVNLASTQKSGLPVRGGIAANGDMLRVDIFTDGKKFYAVPLYVADAIKTLEELPNRAVVASKPEDEWTVMDADKGYRFLFSLHPNEWVRVQQKGKPMLEGYFSGLDRSTGNISFWAHDRNQAVGKDGLIRSIGIKTALSVQKFHVDMLGRLYPVHEETRQALKRHSKG
ncbi:MAG: type II CRISPR RNA-guided endonuclease Cas9 [Halothiobacillaceae bacterium]